jgi:hypothetical protein
MSLDLDYARTEMHKAIENSASHITWIIAREMGKHLGSSYVDIRAREELQYELERFLKS